MSENKSCDMSDDLHSSEIPLKKRKDTRLCNSEPASWRIENSHTGNPLKKRFYRSQLPCDEDESSQKTSTKKKTLFLPPGEEEIICSVSPNSILNENDMPIEENGIFNPHSGDIDSHFSQGAKKLILKPSNEKENEVDVKSDFVKDLVIHNGHMLPKLNSIDSPCDIFAGTMDFSYKKEDPVNSSLIEDLSCKSSSLNSRIHAKDSKKPIDAVNLIMTSVNGSLSDSSKKWETNDIPDIKRLKTEEYNLIPETDKMTMMHKEEHDWFGSTQPVFEHNVNKNAEKSMLNFGSSSVLSQNKVSPSSSLSNYVDYFCNSEINSVPTQLPLHKTEPLLLQENHCRSSGVFEKTIFPIQQSADKIVLFNRGDTHKYFACGNSNPEQELISEIKKKDKYLSRPSSSLETMSFQSNQSPLDFRLILKQTAPQRDQVSETGGKTEGHVIGESTLPENEDDQSRSLKSPIHFNLCANNENSFPHYDSTSDSTSEIPGNTNPNSSHVNKDYIHSSSLTLSFCSRFLFGSEDRIPSRYESRNILTSSSQRNLDYEPSPFDITSYKFVGGNRNSKENGFLHTNYLEDKKDHTKNCLPQINIAKDAENSMNGENLNKKMLLNNQSKLEQNLLNKSEKESKDKVKFFSSDIFSKSTEESSDNAADLESTLIEVCKEEPRNSTYTSPTENIFIQNILLNNGNKLQRNFFHECDKEIEKAKFFLPHGAFTNSRKEDKLKNALIEVCEKELKNSFGETPLTVVKTCDPTNKLEYEHSPRSSYKLEDAVIDLCSNNDKRTSDDGNGDDDVKVIEVFNNNQNSPDLIESCIRPTSSKMSNNNELGSFESVFQYRPSTSKTYSKYDFPTLPLDMTNPHTVHKKSEEPLPSSSYVASGSQQTYLNKSKENVWGPVLPKSYDDYLSISSPDSVISISSSSPSSSPPRRDHNQPIDSTIEDEIFGSLIRVMDRNQSKRPSLLKRAGSSKEIPLLTLPEDESSDEETKPKVSEKMKKDDSSPRSTSTDNKSRSELECAVCLESMNSNRGTSATTCGHVYCTPCIDEVIEKKGECPTCRKALNSTQVHKLFLFA